MSITFLPFFPFLDLYHAVFSPGLFLSPHLTCCHRPLSTWRSLPAPSLLTFTLYFTSGATISGLHIPLWTPHHTPSFPWSFHYFANTTKLHHPGLSSPLCPLVKNLFSGLSLPAACPSFLRPEALSSPSLQAAGTEPGQQPQEPLAVMPRN